MDGHHVLKTSPLAFLVAVALVFSFAGVTFAYPASSQFQMSGNIVMVSCSTSSADVEIDTTNSQTCFGGIGYVGLGNSSLYNVYRISILNCHSTGWVLYHSAETSAGQRIYWDAGKPADYSLYKVTQVDIETESATDFC